MPGEICEVCGQAATIHETSLDGSGARTRHRCARHGRAAWRRAMDEASAPLKADAQAMLDELRRAIERQRDADRR